MYLKFFNLGFAKVLWGMKIVFLGAAILSGFASIRFLHTNPVLGALYTYLFISVIISYVAMFQLAYKVKETLEKLKKLMEMKFKGSFRSDWKYWEKVLRSIPGIGIDVGGFNQVERQAVPIFIDFSIKQIVSLLITFQ